ncbi:MAG: hypothetical protein FWG92_02890 [Leptospirales bacterium]|nr:hypothetical protein [Leptospirales bacterium]
MGKAPGEGWTLSAHYKLTENLTVSGTWVPIGTGANPFTGSFDGDGKTISGITMTNTIAYDQGFFGCIGTGGKVKNLGLLDVDIRGLEYVGGVAGYNLSGTIENCYTTGSIIGAGHIGGIVGGNGYGIVKNCHSTSAINVSFRVSGTDNQGIGGVVGTNLEGTVQNCYATGNITVSIDFKSDDIGGVVGINDEGIVQNCYATGNINITGNASGIAEGVGGVVGANYDGTIQNCYATGNITGNNFVGGVAGYSTGMLQNCVALNATITRKGGSDAFFGRVVGGYSGTLTNNYANQGMAASGSFSFNPGTASNGNGANVLLTTTQSFGWWVTSPGVWSSVWGTADAAPWQWGGTRPKLYFE